MMLAFISTNSFHKNKYICWYEERKWKRKNEEVGDEDWCLIIISSLFLKNQPVLLDLCCLTDISPPALLVF